MSKYILHFDKASSASPLQEISLFYITYQGLSYEFETEDATCYIE